MEISSLLRTIRFQFSLNAFPFTKRAQNEISNHIFPSSKARATTVVKQSLKKSTNAQLSCAGSLCLIHHLTSSKANTDFLINYDKKNTNKKI